MQFFYQIHSDEFERLPLDVLQGSMFLSIGRSLADVREVTVLAYIRDAVNHFGGKSNMSSTSRMAPVITAIQNSLSKR